MATIKKPDRKFLFSFLLLGIALVLIAGLVLNIDLISSAKADIPEGGGGDGGGNGNGGGGDGGGGACDGNDGTCGSDGGPGY